jgi:hypothetical protein
MNRAQELLKQLHEQLRSLLTRIEQSSLVERAMLRFSSWDPQRQALAKSSFRLLMLLILAFLLIQPIRKIRNMKSFIALYEESAFNLQKLGARNSEVRSQAPKPSTWQSLPASNSTELENSMKEYMATIGVQEDLFNARADGLDRLEIAIDDLTLKQALALTFQFDGWYPNVRTENVEIKVHPENADRLQMKISAFIGSALPGGGDYGGDEEGMDHDHEFESSNHEAGSPPAPPSRFNNWDEPSTDDGGSAPPPPPEFNDSPPPVPPPSFDEGFDDPPPVYEDGGDL